MGIKQKTPKQWYQFSEQGAGKNRLILTKHIYQIFGEIPVRIIAFFVVLTMFFKAREQRKASKKFLKLVGKKGTNWESFIQFLNYGNTLVDKIISCLGKLNPDKFIFNSLENYEGAFFITTHIGNVEILRSLFQSPKYPQLKRVNVFMQQSACKTFNDFLKSLEIKLDVEVFPVEEINIETPIMLAERLANGEVAFLAGDRVSAQNENKVYQKDFLDQAAEFPLGTLKFAQILQAPIYFIVCVKEGKNYKVYTERFVTQKEKKSEQFEDLKDKYIIFLEKYARKYPMQYYNFFDIWQEGTTVR